MHHDPTDPDPHREGWLRRSRGRILSAATVTAILAASAALIGAGISGLPLDADATAAEPSGGSTASAGVAATDFEEITPAAQAAERRAHDTEEAYTYTAIVVEDNPDDPIGGRFTAYVSGDARTPGVLTFSFGHRAYDKQPAGTAVTGTAQLVTGGCDIDRPRILATTDFGTAARPAGVEAGNAWGDGVQVTFRGDVLKLMAADPAVRVLDGDTVTSCSGPRIDGVAGDVDADVLRIDMEEAWFHGACGAAAKLWFPPEEAIAADPNDAFLLQQNTMPFDPRLDPGTFPEGRCERIARELYRMSSMTDAWFVVSCGERARPAEMKNPRYDGTNGPDSESPNIPLPFAADLTPADFPAGRCREVATDLYRESAANPVHADDVINGIVF